MASKGCDWPHDATTQDCLVVPYIEDTGKAKEPPSTVGTCIIGCYWSTAAAFGVAMADFGWSILSHDLIMPVSASRVNRASQGQLRCQS